MVTVVVVVVVVALVVVVGDVSENIHDEVWT